MAHAETTQHQSSGSIWSRVNNPLADLGWLYLLTAGIMLILEVHYTSLDALFLVEHDATVRTV